MAAKKKAHKSPKKEKKSHHKPKKVHHIYHDVDQEVSDEIQKIEQKTGANIPLQSRVMGVSLTDYAEYKFLGADGVHDPWLQKMGVNVPKNYSPNMSQVPINVNRGENGMLTIRKFTASDYKQMGTEGIDKDPDIFTGAVKKVEKKIIWPKYYQNPYQYQDYVYLQDIYANTIAGRIFDTIGFFALANGVKPKLRVRNEGTFKTDEEKQKALQ